MAVPRKRHTKGARNQRRAGKNLSQPAIGLCSMCKSPKKPHTVCQVCGTYRQRKVLNRQPKKVQATKTSK